MHIFILFEECRCNALQTSMHLFNRGRFFFWLCALAWRSALRRLCHDGVNAALVMIFFSRASPCRGSPASCNYTNTLSSSGNRGFENTAAASSGEMETMCLGRRAERRTALALEEDREEFSLRLGDEWGSVSSRRDGGNARPQINLR